MKKGLFIYDDLFAYGDHPVYRQAKGLLKSLYLIGCMPDVLTSHGVNVEGIKNTIYTVKKLPDRWLRAFFNRYFQAFVVPDIKRYSLVPFLYCKAKNLSRVNNYDYVMTTSFPCSIHLVGYKMKVRLGLSWVAWFYDPWVGNIYRMPVRGNNSVFAKKDKEAESLVAKYADIIIHSNEKIKEEWVERYGNGIASKIHVIPFLYDKEVPFESSPKYCINRKIVFSHIGKLSDTRNLSSFIDALNQISIDFPVVINKLTINIVGGIGEKDLMKIKDYGLESSFNVVGYLPYDELKKYYVESDIFIVSDAAMQKNVFFPSKLLDYFAYKKPILGITPLDGATGDLLRASGHSVFDNGDIKGIADYIYNAVTDYMSLMNYDRNFISNFFPKKVCENFLKIVDSINMDGV